MAFAIGVSYYSISPSNYIKMDSCSPFHRERINSEPQSWLFTPHGFIMKFRRYFISCIGLKSARNTIKRRLKRDYSSWHFSELPPVNYKAFEQG